MKRTASLIFPFLLYRHIQRAGTHLSAFKVVDWAKRPFPGRDLFMVGEAYHPLRGWIEGALLSAHNALREGWNKWFAAGHQINNNQSCLFFVSVISTSTRKKTVRSQLLCLCLVTVISGEDNVKYWSFVHDYLEYYLLVFMLTSLGKAI